MNETSVGLFVAAVTTGAGAILLALINHYLGRQTEQLLQELRSAEARSHKEVDHRHQSMMEALRLAEQQRVSVLNAVNERNRERVEAAVETAGALMRLMREREIAAADEVYRKTMSVYQLLGEVRRATVAGSGYQAKVDSLTQAISDARQGSLFFRGPASELVRSNLVRVESHVAGLKSRLPGKLADEESLARDERSMESECLRAFDDWWFGVKRQVAADFEYSQAEYSADSNQLSMSGLLQVDMSAARSPTDSAPAAASVPDRTREDETREDGEAS